MNAEIPIAVTDECAARAAQKLALWAPAFRRRSVWQDASKLGLTAGFFQATINQGDHWLGGLVDKTVLLETIVLPLTRFTLVLFSATETWVQKTLEQQGVPLPGHTTH